MVELAYTYITTIKSATKRFLFIRIPTIHSKQFSIFTWSQQSKLLVVRGLKSRLEDYTHRNTFSVPTARENYSQNEGC